MGFTTTARLVRPSLTHPWLWRLLIGSVFAVGLAATFRWHVTLSLLGRYLVCTKTPQPADLILVLAGDFYGPRVLKGAELPNNGYAPRVVISGTPYRARPEDQSRPEGEFALAFLAKQGYRTDSFESFGHHAHSTIEEAIALCPGLERRRVKCVILVDQRLSFAKGFDRISTRLLRHPLHLSAGLRSLLQCRSVVDNESFRGLFFPSGRR